MSGVLSDEERDVGRAVLATTRVNPFLPERREWERKVVGVDFVPGAPVWSLGEEGGDNPNVARIGEVAEDLVERMRRRLERRAPSVEDRELYAAAVFLVLYNRHSGAIPVQGTCGPAEDLGQRPSADGWPAGDVSLAEVQRRYVGHVYRRVGSYKAASEILGIDWRTVKAHVDSPV